MNAKDELPEILKLVPAMVKCAFVERLDSKPDRHHHVSWDDAATLKVRYTESDFEAFLDLLDGEYDEDTEMLNGYIWLQQDGCGYGYSQAWHTKWLYKSAPDVPSQLKQIEK